MAVHQLTDPSGWTEAIGLSVLDEEVSAVAVKRHVKVDLTFLLVWHDCTLDAMGCYHAMESSTPLRHELR